MTRERRRIGRAGRHAIRLASGMLAAASLMAHAQDGDSDAEQDAIQINASDDVSLAGAALATFDKPWAMTFLPDGRSLVTEMGGALWLLNGNGSKAGRISNTPKLEARGQGGFGDIIVHPDFSDNGVVFLSYVERDDNDDTLSGAAVERATLTLAADGGSLDERQVIWRQSPKVVGDGHFSHRLAIAPDGMLFITSGERQKFSPAQNMDMNLGKIVRLNEDGSAPEDNPFHGNGAIADQIWTLGHRNMLGVDFDADGQLWVHEMGPSGGDELNRIVRSENYGYPEVSEGEHYSGEKIPSHADNLTYENPALSWSPVISPSGFVIYDGDAFTDWQGHGLIGGLSSEALIRVEFSEARLDNTGAPPDDVDATETIAKEAARYDWGKRVREVEQGPDGAIYVLEDGEGGRLVRLTLDQ